MFSLARIAPSVVAGCIFGLALLLLMDGIVIAQKEKNTVHHFTFTMLTPAIMSVIGFLLMMMVSPIEIKNDVSRAKAALFIGWIVCFGSTVGALVVCKWKFSGLQERERAIPGVALVGFTSLVPLSGSIVWWGKRSYDDW